ncbi:MAG: Uroporphyrinogen III decarboxylase [Ktedonobacterales bacterium]|jgi:uroporphyrinogen decarboxylase|nr:MAG: Uroporphyrinogen III decarboxylase [Ktedonobacterales bacterium]
MNDRFFRACHREPVDRAPVWFMRQAGRALPEYRAIKAQYSLLDITRQPELCAQVTLQPVRRLGVDAAILYADIMTPLVAIGVDLDIVEGVGPVIAHPVRAASDVAALRPLAPDADMPHVQETIRILRRELAATDTPLIGFAGAPFTLASYLIEGRPSKTFTQTRAMMRDAPDLWHALMERLATLVIGYAQAQIDAGIQAFQLFDSWIGHVSPQEYTTHVQPHVARIFRTLAAYTPRMPLIHFGTGTQHLLELMAAAGGDVIGLDWHVPLDDGWRRVGGPERVAVQGNLNPALLLEPWEAVQAGAADVLRRAGGQPGHIFNLGHGILPTTPVETLERLVAFVHEHEP